MKIRIATVLLILLNIPLVSQAQSWYKQEILNEVWVDFPGIPERTQIDPKTQSYDFTSKCCLYSVGVIVNAIESYDQYGNLSDTEKIKFWLRPQILLMVKPLLTLMIQRVCGSFMLHLKKNLFTI
jgi:hypothetical protein